ncbi:hypothetical protein [Phaeobacter sp. B1627]|uniref:hypothetical protein n=1 Tax=Phaeobacter sp. B1627 TaxID=2583809 RepID=UPI00111B86BA|nr:hypothetical protein [Phaeobacter sp. B1627]TNJ38754.1 hypothetical protein FGE21_19480 [Phaeobacter sp. B1627]
MSTDSVADTLSKLATHWTEFRPESTYAQVVLVTEPLYNVVGSTGDPKIYGETWRQLLISYGIGTGAHDHCYTTDPLPEGASSHPHFLVGGHMTLQQDGHVPTGGRCYLMPLCQWHNSTTRDGIAQQHNLDRMLELHGYNIGEPAVTFRARLPDERPYALVYQQGDAWFSTNLTEAEEARLASEGLIEEGAGNTVSVSAYMLLKREVEDGRVVYSVLATQLPAG